MKKRIFNPYIFGLVAFMLAFAGQYISTGPEEANGIAAIPEEMRSIFANSQPTDFDPWLQGRRVEAKELDVLWRAHRFSPLRNVRCHTDLWCKFEIMGVIDGDIVYTYNQVPIDLSPGYEDVDLFTHEVSKINNYTPEEDSTTSIEVEFQKLSPEKMAFYVGIYSFFWGLFAGIIVSVSNGTKKLG